MDSKRIKGLKTTEYYSGKASIYHNRASYSEECIDHLIELANLSESSTIADIGAGIGNLTKQFCQKGSYKFYLVEPNGDMIQRARNDIASTSITFLQNTAESTGIPDKSVDLLVVGTAFHWFDREAFRQECLRICREDAIVALLRLYMFVPDFTEEDSLSEHTIQASDASLDVFFGNGDFRKKLFFHEEIFDESRFILERLSDHKSPDPGDDDYESFVQKSKQAFSYFGSDVIENTCITVCIYGRLS